MARYIQRFATPYSAQEVANTFSSYLMSEKFEYVELNGDKVWKKGHGLMTAPQYIKLTALNDGTYVLEAWIKFALLPGVYIGEMGTSGFVGAVPKSFLKSRVEMIFRHLNAQMLQTGQNNNINPNLSQAQQYQPQQFQQAAPNTQNQQQNNNQQ